MKSPAAAPEPEKKQPALQPAGDEQEQLIAQHTAYHAASANPLKDDVPALAAVWKGSSAAQSGNAQLTKARQQQRPHAASALKGPRRRLTLPAWLLALCCPSLPTARGGAAALVPLPRALRGWPGRRGGGGRRGQLRRRAGRAEPSSSRQEHRGWHPSCALRFQPGTQGDGCQGQGRPQQLLAGAAQLHRQPRCDAAPCAAAAGLPCQQPTGE